jgi:hypothetical protein
MLDYDDFRGLVFGLLAFFCKMSEELARCINPQPGGPLRNGYQVTERKEDVQEKHEWKEYRQP